MNPDLKNTNDLIGRHLPSASNEDIEVDSARVLRRLRSNTARANDHAFQESILTSKSSSFVRWRIAAAAVVVLGVFIGGISWRESRTVAIAENMDGSLHRVVEGKTEAVVAGERIVLGEIVRSSGGSGSALVLKDGSRIEMRSKSELWFEDAEDGTRIHLRQGSVIVNAAKQGKGRLYVQTKDVLVTVVGTVFLVNAEEEGSRVAVIEGEVRVQQGTTGKNLRPGDQITTNPKMEPILVKKEIAWSRDAGTLAALLQESGKVTGAIRTTDGSPASGIRVTAMRADFADAGLRAMVSLAETDETGHFRLESVPPGTYYIAAGRIDLPTFYPGTLVMTNGVVVSITSAGVVSGVDFVIQDTSVKLPTSRAASPPTSSHSEVIRHSQGATRSAGETIRTTTPQKDQP